MGYAFISYSSENQHEADLINNFFKEHEIDTWMAPYDIRPGGQWAKEINNGIKNCSCFVLILTENSQNSKQVYREVDIAVDLEKPIIPVKLDQSTLNETFEYYLHSQHMVVVSKLNFSDPAFKQVFESVKYWTGLNNDTKNKEVKVQKKSSVSEETDQVDDKSAFETALYMFAQFFEQSQNQNDQESNEATSNVKEVNISKITDSLIKLNHKNSSSPENKGSELIRLSSPTIIRVNIPENLVGETLILDNGYDHVERKAESTIDYFEVNSGGKWIVKVKGIESVKPETVLISNGGQFTQATLTLDKTIKENNPKTSIDRLTETIDVDLENHKEFKENSVIQLEVPRNHLGETVVLKHDEEIIEKEISNSITDITVSRPGLWKIYLKQNPSYKTEVNVDFSKNLKATLKSFLAKIKVSVPKELIGKEIECRDDDYVQRKRADSSSIIFEVDRPGFYEIKACENPFISTVVNVEEERTYSRRLAIDSSVPKLIISTSPRLDGSTLTCSEENGTKVLSKPVKSRKTVFLIPKFGKWTVRCSLFPKRAKTVNFKKRKTIKLIMHG